MADYFAVLNRTLAGFGEPKPELREKLYERARMTIRRQLDSHTPPLDDAALAAEMDKLEQAIHKVESGFGPPNVALDPPKSASEEKPPKESQEKLQEDSGEGTVEAGKETTPPKADKEKAEAPPVEGKRGFLKRKGKKKEKIRKTEPDPKHPQPPKVDADKPADKAGEKKPAPTQNQKPAKAGEEKPVDLPAFVPAKKPESGAADPVSSGAAPKTTDESVDPMDEWAREFLGAQEASKPEVAEALAEMQAERTEVKEEELKERAASIAAAATSAASAKAPAGDLPGFSDKPDDSLTIPSAAQTEAEDKPESVFRWPLIALLVLLALGGVYLALNWENRAEIAANFGLGGLFGDTVKPTPVKTIKITPPPEPEPEPEAAPTTPSTQPEPDTPKSEDRLAGEGQTEQPATPAPEAPAASESAPQDTTPESGETEQAGQQTDQSSDQLPTAEAGATPAVAQSAILYEEGGTTAENTFDTGRIVWSKVEEQGGEGEGQVPAIRARVEVPSRQLVLIMTIKRNSDRALPASHLIELVFAVPDDFSGGSIQEINRYVLKESEQDRGQALIGVPARISDGIFLIALNNLESAQQTNEQLLRNRSWIDIPLQYRTGRRALITLEKGVPGDAVFKEVFEAWDRLNNQP